MAPSIRRCRTCCLPRAPPGSGPRSSRCRCGARSSRAARSGSRGPSRPAPSCRSAGRAAATGPRHAAPSARWYTSTATGTSRSDETPTATNAEPEHQGKSSPSQSLLRAPCSSVSGVLGSSAVAKTARPEGSMTDVTGDRGVVYFGEPIHSGYVLAATHESASWRRPLELLHNPLGNRRGELLEAADLVQPRERPARPGPRRVLL